jgi:aryl-alcohol dehydrogenase-like predicted oxidoreductase
VTERIELAPGFSVCRVINGLWQLSRGHRPDPVDPSAAIDTLLRLVDAGFTTFDCADIYLGVEELLGRMLEELKGSRRDPSAVQIHTKYVPDRSALPELRKLDVRRSIEGSLARLGVERLDLVQFHWWDFELPNYLDAAGWLSDLRDEGKIRCLGTTNFDTRHLENLLEAGIPVITNQAQYSLLDRRAEGGMSELCQKAGMRLLCYGVLAGGFLSERYLGAAELQPPFKNRSLTKYRLIIDEFGGWDLYQRLLQALAAVAARHATTIAAVAARWVLAREPVAAVVVGVRSREHIEDNRSIFDLHLDEEDLARLDEILTRSKGPTGDPFELERKPGGPHSAIMWTDLNRQRS